MKNSADLSVMLDNRRNVMRYVMMMTGSVLLMTACDPAVLKEDTSDTALTITSVVGISGHDDEEGDMIMSDVSPVFNDNVKLTLKAYTKSPRGTSSYLENVTLEQYEVRYVRVDGNNVEGVDVPYGISGRLTKSIVVGADTEIGFIVVRHQAKLEPPLKNLRYDYLSHAGGRQLIKVDALITVYGRNGTGDVVKAEASIMINFADYAND